MDTKLVQQLENVQGEIQDVEAQIMQATAAMQTKLKSLKEQDVEVRAAIKEAMEKNSVKKFESDRLVLTYVAESTRKSIDSAKLKAEAPGIYDKYLKETKVSASVRIKVKE